MTPRTEVLAYRSTIGDLNDIKPIFSNFSRWVPPPRRPHSLAGLSSSSFTNTKCPPSTISNRSLQHHAFCTQPPGTSVSSSGHNKHPSHAETSCSTAWMVITIIRYSTGLFRDLFYKVVTRRELEMEGKASMMAAHFLNQERKAEYGLWKTEQAQMLG